MQQSKINNQKFDRKIGIEADALIPVWAAATNQVETAGSLP